MFKLILRSGLSLQLLVFLASAFLLWGPAMVHPLPMIHTVHEGPLYAYLVDLMTGSPQLSTAIAFSLVVSASLLFNYLLMYNDLSSRSSLLVAIFYIILISWNRTNLCLTPMLPASLFLIASVFTLQRMYGLTDVLGHITTASFFVALAGLFYYPAMIFIFLIWLGLLTYRVVNWREWMLSIIGFLLPLLYLLSYYYLVDLMPSKIEPFQSYFSMNNWHIPELNTYHKIFYLAIVLIFLFTLNSYSATVKDKVIRIRKRSSIILDYTIAGILVVMVTISNLELTHQFLMLPLAFYMSNVITLNKRKGNSFEYLFLLFVIFIGVIRFFNL